MVKSRRLIGKANISSISEISFNWKWLIRKGAQYGFNVPNRYLKTKPLSEHDKEYFSN